MRSRVLGLGALVVCALLGPFGMTAAHSADRDTIHTVDAYVAALGRNPVLVQPTMGAGHTDAVRRKLTALAKALPYPVHVALVQAPTDLQSDDISRDLTSAIRRKLGEPGLYVVAPSNGRLEVQVTGNAVPQTKLSLASTAVERVVNEHVPDPDWKSSTAAVGAQIVLEVAAADGLDGFADDGDYDKVLLSDGEVDALAHEPWAFTPTIEDSDDESHVGKRWMVGTVSGLATLLVLAQSIIGWPGWSRRRATGHTPEDRAARHPRFRVDRVPRPSAAHAKSEAERKTAALAQAVAAMPSPVPHPEIAEDALKARVAAESVLDGDYLDLLGAMALAESGLEDVRRARRKAPGPRHRHCYFNPLHGRTLEHTEWQYGDSEVDVPACGPCMAAVIAGRTPDILRLTGDPSAKAYFEGDSVWARTGYGALVDHFGAAVLADREGGR